MKYCSLHEDPDGFYEIAIFLLPEASLLNKSQEARITCCLPADAWGLGRRGLLSLVSQGRWHC